MAKNKQFYSHLPLYINVENVDYCAVGLNFPSQTPRKLSVVDDY